MSNEEVHGNILFEYLYRDGSNYKAWGAIVFSNPMELLISEIDGRLRRAFDSELFFIANQIEIPEIFLYRDGLLTGDDHCFHEYDHVELTNDSVTDMYNRTISDFLAQIEAAAQHGWEVFDPCDWLIRSRAARSSTAGD
jgi:hypothetical protein